MGELPHSADLRQGRFSEPGAAYFITKCREDVGLRRAAQKAREDAGQGRPAHRTGRDAGQGRPAHRRIASNCPCFANPAVAEIIIDSIRWHQEQRHAHLLAFVVMPDHVHWLFVLGERRSLDKVMHGFGSVTWQGFRRACGRDVGKVWEDEYHDHRLRSEERVWATLDYVHENPVRRGLCARAEDWPWSTVNPRFRPWIEEDYLR